MSSGLARAFAIGCVVFAILMLVLLWGCATDQAVAKVETVTVDRPVAVACLTPESIPKAPERAQTHAGASVDQEAAALGAELLQRREYDATATALLQSCATIPPTKGSP